MAYIAKTPSHGTYIERVLERTLRLAGYRGIRLQAADLPGTPDVAADRERIAGFAHGCFWHQHGCSLTWQPQGDEWERKFSANRSRDLAVKRELMDAGWRIVWLWECAALQYGPLVLANEIKQGFARGWQGIELTSPEHRR
jgi:DNA mismatch endonuclease (patch repair protein)